MTDKKIENPAVQARIPHELNDKLEQVSKMFGLPKNDIVRFAVAQFCGSVLGTMDKVQNSMNGMAEIMDKAIQKGLEKPESDEDLPDYVG